MSFKEKPYIGVTGIDSLETANTVGNVFKNNGLAEGTFSHRGMAGYLVSLKSLRGESTSNKFPPLHQLAYLLEASKPSSLNIIHYNTAEEDTLADQVCSVFARDSIYNDRLCRGVQLNTPLPNIGCLVAIKREMPELKIVLQINEDVISRINRAEIVRRLVSCRTLVNYVLIDLSSGRGKPLDPRVVAPYYRIARHVLPTHPVILAGGFNDLDTDASLQHIEAHLQNKDFGIDAQKGLRINADKDRLVPQKLERYVRKAVDFFRAENSE